MSAPAAIAVAKLNWPEVDESVFKHETNFDMGDGYAMFTLHSIYHTCKDAVSLVHPCLIIVRFETNM